MRTSRSNRLERRSVPMRKTPPRSSRGNSSAPRDNGSIETGRPRLLLLPLRSATPKRAEVPLTDLPWSLWRLRARSMKTRLLSQRAGPKSHGLPRFSRTATACGRGIRCRKTARRALTTPPRPTPRPRWHIAVSGGKPGIYRRSSGRKGGEWVSGTRIAAEEVGRFDDRLAWIRPLRRWPPRRFWFPPSGVERCVFRV